MADEKRKPLAEVAKAVGEQQKQGPKKAEEAEPDALADAATEVAEALGVEVKDAGALAEALESFVRICKAKKYE